MVKVTGSCNVVSRKPNGGITDPSKKIEEFMKKRRIAKRELRKKELTEKSKNGKLTTAEAMELAAIRLDTTLENIAKLSADSVCYTA